MADKSTEVEVATERPEVKSTKDVMAMIASMAENKTVVYSTVVGEDFESKKITLNAITNSEPLADHLREPINLTNFIVQGVQVIDDETGEENDALRIILIDDEGKAYHAISTVLFKDLQTYTALLGNPSTWESPVTVTVDELKNGKRRFFKMKLA